MKQLTLPGLELPKMGHFCQRDQQVLYYLGEKGGSMRPLDKVDYSRLIAAGLVTRQKDTVHLTPDGWTVLRTELDQQINNGVIFHCRVRS